MCRKITPEGQKKVGEFLANRYQCKVCSSTKRLFGQCLPCLTKFAKANGVISANYSRSNSNLNHKEY